MAADFVRDERMPLPYGLCEQFRFNLTALNGDEETYNPIQAVMDIYSGFSTYFRCWEFLNQTSYPITDLTAVGQVTWYDLAAIILFTILWIITRIGLTRHILEPFAQSWGMRNHATEKFPESCFKALSYLFLWVSAVYVTFFRGHKFFFNTLALWSDCKYKFGEGPLDLRLVYGFEASFYLYSSYATLFLDKWRRDSLVMLLHHVITVTLICFAYSVSHLKIGILIFVLNDFSDVLLEGSKCFAYLRVKGSRFAQVWHILSHITVASFAISWFVCRSLGHLTKVWRSSSFGSFYSMPYLPPPLYLFFNVLVGTLYLFYLYWGYLIVLFIVRLFSGNMKDPDDIRDEEVEEACYKEAARKMAIKEEKNEPGKRSLWWLSSPGQKSRKTD